MSLFLPCDYGAGVQQRQISPTRRASGLNPMKDTTPPAKLTFPDVVGGVITEHKTPAEIAASINALAPDGLAYRKRRANALGVTIEEYTQRLLSGELKRDAMRRAAATRSKGITGREGSFIEKRRDRRNKGTGVIQIAYKRNPLTCPDLSKSYFDKFDKTKRPRYVQRLGLNKRIKHNGA